MKRILFSLGFLGMIGLQATASASYSTDCVAYLSSHFTQVSDGAFYACQQVNNPYALQCIEQTSTLQTVTDGTFRALTRCASPYAVSAVHELFTRFTTISDGAVWYVAGTFSPDAAACVDNLAANYSQLTDAAFAACAQ